MNTKHKVAIGGAIGLIVGSFLEWASIDTPFGSFSVSGMDGDGVITVSVGIIALVLFTLVKRRAGTIAGVVFAAIGAAIAAIDIADVKSNIDDIAAESEGLATASVGIGLWLCLAGALVAVVGGILSILEQRGQPAATQSAPTGSPLPPPPPPQ